jgi:hypothetical protein
MLTREKLIPRGKANMSVPGPGWFVNPEDDRQLRWWSGEAWTEYKQAVPQPQEAPIKPTYVPMAGYSAQVCGSDAPKLKRGEKDRQVRKNNSFAYTGCVLALVSFLFNPLAILSVLGIVFSAIGLARSHELEDRGMVTGRGVAIAGIVLGLVGLAFVGWRLSQLVF